MKRVSAGGATRVRQSRHHATHSLPTKHGPHTRSGPVRMNWTDLAFRFGPAEYTATLVLLLTVVCLAAPQPLARSGGMAITGLLLGIYGQDRYGEARDMTGLGALFDDPALLVACVAIFAMLVPQIARHYLPRTAAPSRSATLWSAVYQCAGFWPGSVATIATARWTHRTAWTGPVAAVWCGWLLAWYGWTPNLLWICALLAVVGLMFVQVDCPVVPLLIGMVVSPMLEENLGRALMLSRGEWWPLVLHRPIVAGMLASCLVGVVARAVLLDRRKLQPATP